MLICVSATLVHHYQHQYLTSQDIKAPEHQEMTKKMFRTKNSNIASRGVKESGTGTDDQNTRLMNLGGDITLINDFINTLIAKDVSALITGF